jgi:hypothetical protein
MLRACTTFKLINFSNLIQKANKKIFLTLMTGHSSKATGGQKFHPCEGRNTSGWSLENFANVHAGGNLMKLFCLRH